MDINVMSQDYGTAGRILKNYRNPTDLAWTVGVEKDERFAIQIVNEYGVPVYVVVAFNGRNVLTGQPAGELSVTDTGFLLGPKEVFTINRWGDVTSRKPFVFTGLGDDVSPHHAPYGSLAAVGEITVGGYSEGYVDWKSYQTSGAPQDGSGLIEPEFDAVYRVCYLWYGDLIRLLRGKKYVADMVPRDSNYQLVKNDTEFPRLK